MSTLMEELTAIKAVEDKLTANKLANFAYTDHAYNNPLTEADGVASYDPDAEQNIPNANASTLQVNSTILTKGWRAQASAITRMLMNHFLGRCSYNLNKINDLFSTLLTKLMGYLGQPNGIATLDEDGYVPSAQINVTRESLDIDNVVNTGDSATPVQNGTTKFTTGGAYTLQQAINGCAPKDHSSTATTYGKATNTKYGHVRISPDRLWTQAISGNVSFSADNGFPQVPNVIKNVDLTGAHTVTISIGAGITPTRSNIYYGLMFGSSFTLNRQSLTTGGGSDSALFTVPAGGVLILLESLKEDNVINGVY